MAPSWAIAGASTPAFVESGPPPEKKMRTLGPDDVMSSFAGFMSSNAASSPVNTGSSPVVGELDVILDKSSGDTLGIDIDQKDGQTLLITAINDGLVGDWNEISDGDRICVGDRIVEANGARGQAELITECKKSQVLHLKVSMDGSRTRPINSNLYTQILDHLQEGNSQEALKLLRLADSNGSVIVEQMAALIDNTSVWCQEEHMIGIFNRMDECKLVKFPDPSSGTYFVRFSRWAVREYLAEALSTKQQANSAPAMALERSGTCVARLIAQYKGGGMELLLNAEGQLPQNHQFTRRELLYVTFPDTGRIGDGKSSSYEAVLEGFRPFGLGPHKSLSVTMRACTGEILMGLHGQTCRVDRAANRVTFRRQVDALLQIAGEPGDLEWLAKILTVGENPERCGDAAGLCAESPPGVDIQGRTAEKMAANIVSTANPSQQEAIKFATTQRMTLIQGPPGTGKTSTSLLMIKLWMLSGRKPIMATAPSNIAVDNLLQGCVKAGFNVLRIGREETSQQNLKEHTLIQKARAAGFGPGSGKAGWEAEKRIVDAADIICCTCSGAAHAHLEDIRFKGLLIDEVGQATELAVLVPLMRLHPNGQVALVGDHKQLPPTVQCLEADVEGYGNSLFERLASQGVPPRMLNIQYRMHPSLAIFPSQAYYKGMLYSGTPGSARRAPKGIMFPQPGTPMVFVHTEGAEQKEGNSWTNHAEVRDVVTLVQGALSGGDVIRSEIGIITPYAAQAAIFRQALGMSPAGKQRRNQGLTAAQMVANELEVSSVDGFQGREKDLIFVSTVRANAQGNVGFVGDYRRMNVSLTRARRGLVVCGNVTTLAKDTEGWMPWVLWMQERGLIAGWEATNPEAAEELAKLDKLSTHDLLAVSRIQQKQVQEEDNQKNAGEASKLKTHKLVVKDGVGAGLDVVPEDGGMRVMGVSANPGQGKVRVGDLIVAIDGVDLGSDVYSVVQAYGEKFRDGALLSIAE